MVTAGLTPVPLVESNRTVVDQSPGVSCEPGMASWPHVVELTFWTAARDAVRVTDPRTIVIVQVPVPITAPGMIAFASASWALAFQPE